MLVVLSTAIGTIVGVTAGLLMINRKGRVSPTEAHLAALEQEFSASAPAPAPPVVSAPGVSLEDLRKLVADRDDALRQSCDDLQRAQLLCDQARSQAQQESIQRAAAVERAQELAAQVAALTQQAAELDARTQEQESLAVRVANLTEELAAARNCSQEEGSYRSSLEAQLTADREHIRQLTAQIADLKREFGNFETRLLEQRQLAAKGLEFLNLAQHSFAGVSRILYNGVETPVAAE
jgi:chromosome segregation ATPase